MAEQIPSVPGTGRSRGRARGRPAVIPTPDSETMQAMRISPSGDNGNGNGSSNGNGSNGNGDSNGNGEGAAVRGRGGYRQSTPGVPIELDTRPSNITSLHSPETGEVVKLLTNYFRLNTPKDKVINDYHVKFEPVIEATFVRKKLLYGIEGLFGDAYMFDGDANIKTVANVTEPIVKTVRNPREGAADENIIITITRTSEIGWGSAEMLRLFNIMMRKNLYILGHVLMGMNYFDPKGKLQVPGHAIGLMPGVVTAVGNHDAGLLMVVDSATKTIRNETVLEMLGKLKQQRPSDWLDEAKRQLCGSIVMTAYNNKTYKIHDLVTDKNPTETFERRGHAITLADYYKEAYKVTIRSMTQPLIVCNPTKKDIRCGRTTPLLLIPELCQMTGLTDQMKSDFNLMRAIRDVSCLKPADRIKNLNQFMSKMTNNAEVKTELQRWDLKIDPKLVEVKGRLLTCESIYMSNDTDQSASKFQQRTGDFGKEIRSKRLFTPCSLTKWMIIYTQRDNNLVEDFAETMRRVCGPMGIQLMAPRKQVLENDRVATYVAACQQLAAPCEMAVLIVSNNNKDRYDAIKKICYCENPMPSQVIVARTLAKKQMLMSVCTKVAIQMAAKLGAEPWALKIPPKNLMVVGYDTYHDSSIKGRSVGGFVCSLNATLTSWYSRAAYHQNEEEMSSNFALHLKEGLKAYYDRNRTLPLKIVVYRDGVSDGQIAHVFKFELKQMLDALKMISQESPPQLAFVIVTKRISARFFARNARGEADNPIPGTVVDRDVTREKRYDFFLISQSVRQGTVTPTMYNIIHDGTSFKAEHHQQLAYKLTHLYFNWQGTIRVPAPCQYAHKLAYLVGTSLHREPDNSLSTRLFYL